MSTLELPKATTVSIVTSSPRTVKFSGGSGVTLIADEWNRSSTTAAGQPTILMLQGSGQSRFSWKHTSQILAEEGLHVVALDARGPR